MYRFLFISLLTLTCVGGSIAQETVSKREPVRFPVTQAVAASSAYAELVVHRTNLESTLESLLIDYNEGYPKVKALRSELALLNAEIMRLVAVKAVDAGRLTSALGRLMLQKVALETELDALRSQYKDEHPDVRKLKRKIEIYESAIKEILG